MKQTFIVGIETNHKNFNDWMAEHDKSLCHSLRSNQELKKCETIIELPCLGDTIYRIDLDEIEEDDFEIESYVIECISISDEGICFYYDCFGGFICNFEELVNRNSDKKDLFGNYMFFLNKEDAEAKLAELRGVK